MDITTTKTTTKSRHPVAGVWQRIFEEYPLGSGELDRETVVLWIQTPVSGIYIDLRLSPASMQMTPRPQALAANGYSTTTCTWSDDQITTLLQQQSFAGILHVQAGDTTKSKQALQQDAVLRQLATGKHADTLCTCFWERFLDYQPPSSRLDVGVCVVQQEFADHSTVTMRETGDDASYAEEWLRLGGTNKGPFMALELIMPERTGYWVRAGDWFAYAIGYPHAMVPKIQGNPAVQGKSLTDILGNNENNASYHVAGNYLAAAGRIVTTTGSKNTEWKILYSTHPELVGCNLLVEGCGGENNLLLCCSTVCSDTDQGTVQQTIPVDHTTTMQRTWKVRELSAGCSLPGARREAAVYGMDPHPDFVEHRTKLLRSFDLESFSLTPLSPAFVDEDFSAVTESTTRLKGLFGDEWPEGLTLADNRIDLAWHEREFTLGRSFSWIVRNKRTQAYVGCAYVFPGFAVAGETKVVTWIREGSDDDDNNVQQQLVSELKLWLEDACPGVKFQWS